MTDDQPSTDDRSGTRPSHDELRRRLLAIFGGAGVTLLAGCASSADFGSPADSTGDDGSDGSSGGGAGPAEGDTGTFRLLISDRPVAIDEFDSLSVSFDRARIFRGGGDDAESGAAAAETSSPASPTATDTPTQPPSETITGSPTPTPTGTASETETAESAGQSEVKASDDPDDEDADDDQQGFTVIDLEGATVDLTQVVGDKAIEVFDGGLPTGRYTKIELYASGVVGHVDGEEVDVMIPSGKLMLTKPFEVTADEGLDFVYDITVVKKGPNGYNLLPVIGESGVAGRDVPVDEIEPASEPEQAAGAAEQEAEDGEDEESEAPDDDAGAGGQGAGADGDPGNGTAEGSG